MFRAMKLILLAGMAVSAVWAQGGSAQHRFSLPPQAYEVASGVMNLGTQFDVDGTLVEGYVFIHPRRRAVGPPNGSPGPGNGGPGGGGGNADCYKLFQKGMKWKTAEPYILDPNNGDGLSSQDLISWTATSLAQWEVAAGIEIFGDPDAGGVVDGADTVQPDGKNEVMFGDIADNGVIAVTLVWMTFQGKQIVEWDAIFDDADFTWGYAGETNESQPGDITVMDYPNVATHEFGHAAGLDHPSQACTEETMHAFAANGETKKRTLNPGDIAGIQVLY